MNSDNIISMWYFIIFVCLIPINYRALMALDFSKIFKYNSTWQIRLLVTFLSIIIAFIISFAFMYSISIIIGIISI